MNDSEILRVDRKRAYRMLAIAAAGAVVLYVALSFVYDYFNDAMPSSGYPLTPERLEELRFQLRVTMLVLCLAMACCFIPHLWYGARTLKHRMHPPPGAIIFRDTRVIVGRRAMWRGFLLLALGTAGIAAVLYAAWIIDRMLVK